MIVASLPRMTSTGSGPPGRWADEGTYRVARRQREWHNIRNLKLRVALCPTRVPETEA